MLRRRVLAWLPVAAWGAAQQTPPKLPPPDKEDDPRLPDGRSQRDEILKADFDKSLQDAADLQRLSAELRSDLEKATAFVVPVQAIKKTEEIEKIAKRIRGRLKRS
jgi:Xaa-Pro aminopeptidase